MISRRMFLASSATFTVSACASKFKTYTGPEVTRIQVFKGQRAMQLLHHNTQLAAYEFELGFSPEGHKAFYGDGRTPEGAYLINRQNPNSRYHLSLGISYPDADDIAYARSLGREPGGDIFIHGTPKLFAGKDDWTYGCIAVEDEEMEDIYAMVQIGTPIYIYA